MAVYIVTGKLGAGKTLLLILKILDYLKAGRRVAVNVDVKMDKLCKRDNKYSRLIRLPDLPSAADLIGLEFGHDTYDEEKFGGIFLDEAGVWLNSRDWNQGGRTDLLKFFLFLRKRRWDLWLAAWPARLCMSSLINPVLASAPRICLFATSPLRIAAQEKRSWFVMLTTSPSTVE